MKKIIKNEDLKNVNGGKTAVGDATQKQQEKSWRNVNGGKAEQ